MYRGSIIGEIYSQAGTLEGHRLKTLLYIIMGRRISHYCVYTMSHTNDLEHRSFIYINASYKLDCFLIFHFNGMS